MLEPSPRPGTSAPEPTATPTVIPVDAENIGPAVYYVAIDDGGARGVRFGCNDSLVPVRGVATPGDPLSVALSRLLETGMPVDSDAALYDALANSSLRYLSGYMSGATVVVNLSGSLRPGGVCDIPRIQAQLTQTIVQASGASRAEIYVNGRTLTEALSVR
ncbi:GerMN domain-containing protein [Paenarthrobacter aurescens]|uniref:GerMN domain-containing protein n=1 Tax=Paenarthrobacter aurescens TaxID=43663 RepID=UPI001FE6D49B|nr:GerMN domain-containing protein [Paenarthrobacter aurescens]MDO6145352.1 GerMN domain-containing protein [Paenarthrobacter aurescens]MDO6149157.1 GerMN domain-containing protein [Paenarthrobacter aurescens]MDO6160401.1 GerMN domain-containing protein [Paenarthrobacter aurescens]MDO6164260.1 GerMN domain-containing protein [Paenarthrobacter aurescens]